MEQLSGSKLGKEYLKAVYCQLFLLLPTVTYLLFFIVTYLYNLYAEYIMWNAKVDESQVGI